jgi:hypothetical protein
VKSVSNVLDKNAQNKNHKCRDQSRTFAHWNNSKNCFKILRMAKLTTQANSSIKACGTKKAFSNWCTCRWRSHGMFYVFEGGATCSVGSNHRKPSKLYVDVIQHCYLCLLYNRALFLYSLDTLDSLVTGSFALY